MADPSSGQRPGRGDISPEDRAKFEQRVHELGDKLERVKAEHEARNPKPDAAIQRRGMAYGMRMTSELIAAILVGGGIGYLLDRALGTTPWLFLVFFMCGFAAGILNVVRGFQRLQGEITAKTGGKLGKSVPDDD